jgi:hypothetical protein
MPHTRANTKHLRPQVDDTFFSNLRAPIMTLVEDTSPGIHDTLIAACDPQRYKELGVKEWEKHGSCAENLVFALNEFNQKIGLKGARAVGSDVTVNMVPAPLNLFMNIPWDSDGNVKFDGPKSKKGDYVRLRAERDVVVVMSACPQDILDINGKKPQAAHFIVEDNQGKPSMKGPDGKTSLPTSPSSPQQFSGAEASLAKLRERGASTPKPAKLPSKTEQGQSTPNRPTPSKQASEQNASPKPDVTKESQVTEQSPAPKKKPKKLERRATPKASD